MGRWSFERPLDGMQVNVPQRCLAALDLPMDVCPLQAIFAHRRRLYTSCTNFIESKMQPLCDQTLSCLRRVSVRTLKRCVFLQAQRTYTLEVFGFDRFQTASFLAPGTYLQTCA